jgi:fatty-acid desaturase
MEHNGSDAPVSTVAAARAGGSEAGPGVVADLRSPQRHAADRLPLPDAVDLSSINWLYGVPIVAVHAVALLAVLPWLFSWSGLILMVVGVHLFGQAINLCYHRQLTHRSFKTSRVLERFFVLVALCCMQDTPGRWVATHRFHHAHSDEQPDPHSPLVSFLWSHTGWLIARNAEMERLSVYQKYAREVLEDPFYMWLERHPGAVLAVYVGHGGLFFVVGFLVGWLAGGAAAAGLQLGLSWLVWAVFVRTVAVWHITWSVNSLTHLFGYANYATGENSRNNWLVAILTVGEGWHNNHHHDQASASNQHRWWEIDITYYEIRLLALLGLAWDVVPPRHTRLAAIRR